MFNRTTVFSIGNSPINIGNSPITLTHGAGNPPTSTTRAGALFPIPAWFWICLGIGVLMLIYPVMIKALGG